VARTADQAAHPMPSRMTKAGSGRPTQPAATYTGVPETGKKADKSTASLASRTPRPCTFAVIAAVRGLWLASLSTTRGPHSLPAHQVTQFDLSIPGSGAAIAPAKPSLLPAAQNAPAATIEVLLPDSNSSSSGCVAISAGVSGIIAIPYKPPARIAAAHTRSSARGRPRHGRHFTVTAAR
jgi:hypothetical protein